MLDAVSVLADIAAWNVVNSTAMPNLALVDAAGHPKTVLRSVRSSTGTSCSPWPNTCQRLSSAIQAVVRDH